MQSILHDVYVKERKLNVLYGTLAESDDEDGEDGFFLKACDDQSGGLELLQEINRKYGNTDIDVSILEKLGETVKRLKSSPGERGELIKQVLEFESELVEDYKRSLRFLTADDATRKMVNKMLTVKLVHKRDLLDKMNK